MTVRFIVYSLLMVFVAACQSKAPDSAVQHLISAKTGGVNAGKKKIAKGAIPEIVQATPFLVKPEKNIQEERYTVVLHDVPVKELLFTLARDSNINIDIHSDIEGSATINAVEETLPSILERLARQVDFLYEIKNGVLVIRPDSKFWQVYNVDHLSMERSSSGSMSLGLKSGSEVETTSTSDVTTSNDSKFWQPIVDGIINIIKLDDALVASEVAKRESAEKKSNAADEEVADEESTDEEAATEEDSGDDPVITHKSTGTISVLATSRQHRQIQIFFDNIMASSQRQVLIEATIVEVQLNDYFQRGIDWSKSSTSSTSPGINAGFGNAATATATTTAFTGSNLASSFSVGQQISSKLIGGSLTVAMQFLDEFGDVSVLSSPKVMAINNQAAMMKVVDERIYFKLDITPATSTTTNGVTTTTPLQVESEKQTSLEGVLLSVTPHINDNGIITLHVRPTISQFMGWITDPSVTDGVATNNKVPQFQVREMDSILRVPDGQIVVLGGMMRDKVTSKVTKIPGVSMIPFLGAAFEKKTREVNKTELAIFLRPTIITPQKMRDEVDSMNLSFEEIKNRFGNDKAWNSIKRKD
ncbi:MAG: hypothetical protein HQL71_04365 [Magnetococcales bacterium]|nr:hypothetical protein [Magnetococcales bacterium]